MEGEDKEDLKALRRGWVLGGEEFLERLEGVVKGALGLAGIKEVKRLRKNDKRKQALVWLVKSRTVVGHERILDRLEMGHRSNVTRAMAGFRNGGDRETRGLKAKMITCSD